MSDRHSHLHSGPSATSTATSEPKSKISKTTVQSSQPLESQRQPDQLKPLHGVPILSPSDPVSSSRPKPRHGRSHSNSLISIFNGGKRSDKKTSRAVDGDALDVFDDSDVVSTGLPFKESAAGVKGNHPHKGMKVLKDLQEFMTGKCLTCGCIMTWPKEVHTFRCGTCLMINDLEHFTGSLADLCIQDTLADEDLSASIKLQKSTSNSHPNGAFLIRYRSSSPVNRSRSNLD